MSVDYKLLLWKYINHVGECEGSIFDPARYYRAASSVKFTEEELSAFVELADAKHAPAGDAP
jgi:hypothetical protein